MEFKPQDIQLGGLAPKLHQQMGLEPADVEIEQKALETLDQQGEAALLDFLIVHRKPNPDPDARHGEGRWLHVFDDDSLVRIDYQHYLYIFCWDESQTRPATSLAQTMPLPLPPGPNTPLLDWPNVESIAHALVRRVEQQARKALGLEETRDHGNDPVLNDYQRLTLAPGLDGRIREFAQKVYDMPDELLRALDEEQEYCAQMTLDSLPEEQRAALYAAVAEAMQAQAEE